MNENDRRRFDLARFVVGFLEQQEGIVTPPAYGVYEALLPDKLADDLRLDPYQRLTFTAVEGGETLDLSYGHPIVEEIAERLQQKPANACVYINHVRTDKQGVLDLARVGYAFPNARLSPKANATQGRALHHYLRFNFKVALVSDEKQELLISVVMDVQGGYAVRDVELLERLEFYESKPAHDGLPVATAHWRDDGDPLNPETYDALLPRAEAAVLEEIAATLTALQTRADRHLQLDRARIEGYYDDLERDLKRRSDRISAADEKLSALHAERKTKLDHLAERYQIRVELELINLLLLVQPKIRLPVNIGNRSVNITRTVVWDPLVHRLEPLVCDVCGQPGQDLHLCTGGHLAHDHCLAERCIDCSRVYCRLCDDQMGECAVCHEPVCQRSLITCPTCGRGTCREHQALCHAADGAPVDLATLAAEPEQPPTPKPPAPEKTQPDKPGRRGNPTKQKQKPAPASNQRLVKAVRIEVNLFEERPQIVAHVMRSANRTWAVRSILLTREGISVKCECEKGDTCEANGYIHRPANARYIAEQLEKMLKLLRSEYLTPAKKMNYTYVSHDRVLRESQTLELPEIWLDEERLREARSGFDRLR